MIDSTLQRITSICKDASVAADVLSKKVTSLAKAKMKKNFGELFLSGVVVGYEADLLKRNGFVVEEGGVITTIEM